MAESKLLLSILVLLSGDVVYISCANILIAEDLASPSHQIFNYAIADALVARGHNVTVLGPKSISLKSHNFHLIALEDLYETTSKMSILHPDEIEKTGIFDNLRLLNDYGVFSCNFSLHTNGFRTLMNYPKDFKFDLIIFDVTLTYCLLPLAEKFNYPPTIAISALLLAPHVSEAFGNTFQASYLPYIFLKYSEEMSFIERIQNFVWNRFDMSLRNYIYKPQMEAIARTKYGKDMPSFDTLVNHIPMLLCNLIPGFHYPQSISSNIIPVGGLHINVKKLPEDLQEIMDNAKHGVVLFSLGSNVRSDSLSPARRQAILEAFGELKETVLWKFESSLTDVPQNVFIRKWLPQNEILAHPNLKLFISHGGGLSTIEAAYFGVPLVGMPFFVDQHYNIALIVNKKLGVKIEYRDLTKEALLKSIREVLDNPRYSQGMKKISRIIQDQPQTSLERAVFWIEFTMRHNGTHIFDPKSRYLTYFVRSSLDMHLLIFLVLSFLAYLFFKMVLLLISHLRKDIPGKRKKE